MRAYYEARLEDLTAADFVQIECLRCGHVEQLTGSMLATAGVAPHETIMNLERRLRCRQCDGRGHALVNIIWYDAPTR
jgi:hypothetical protein